MTRGGGSKHRVAQLTRKSIMGPTPGRTEQPVSDSMDYGAKVSTYFHGERRDFVDALPRTELSFL